MCLISQKSREIGNYRVISVQPSLSWHVLTTTLSTHLLTNDEALLIEGGTAILVMQHFLITSSGQYSCPPTTPSFLRLWAQVILRVKLGVHQFPSYHCDYMCAHVHIARSCIILIVASSLWLVSCPDPTLSWGKGSGDHWAISWLCRVSKMPLVMWLE